MKYMKGLVYNGLQGIQLKGVVIPQIEKDNDVIIQIEATGICGTDLNIYKGRFSAKTGTVLGHESVGIIAKKGSGVTEFSIGDRVLIDPTMWCGACNFCRKGRFNFCENKQGCEVGVDYDGAFAAYIKMPKGFVYRIPENISWEKAALIEPLACVLNNFDAGGIHYGDSVLILGGGPIGGIAGILARKIASYSLNVDSSEYRVNYLNKMGLKAIKHDTKIDGDLITYIGSIMNFKPSVVIDTTGVLCNEAIRMVERGGRVILMGFNSTYQVTTNAGRIVNEGVKIIGAGDYNLHIQDAIELSGSIEIEKLVSHTFPLENYKEAIDLLTGINSDISAMKILLKP